MRNVFLTILFIVLAVSCTLSLQKSKRGDTDGVRIISLAPSITKEVEELGMAGNIVGATSYCDITKGNKELIIGDAINVNVEKVLLLKPDVILTTTLTKQSTIDLFRENGIKVDVIGKLDSFNDICRQFNELGKTLGCPDAANLIIDRTKSRIDSIRQTIPERVKGKKIFIQIGADPLFAVIPETFMDDYIKFADCENITIGFGKGTISRETILNRNPDVILIATMGIVATQEKNRWESFGSLNAVKDGKVFIIDANKACVPTVKNFEKAFEEIVHLLVN